MKHLLPAAALLFCLPLLSPLSAGQELAKPLQFGMSAAFTGPAGDLGLNMRAGIEAAFAEVNAAGGIRGRPLQLTSLDDGYEPERTVPNMEALVANPECLGVIGNVGTPTALVALPIARAHGLLYFGAFSGADTLRKSPPDRIAINYRASYSQETSAMVDALVEHAGFAVEEIAFFTQRDGYGDAGYTSGLAALARLGLEDARSIQHVRYQRNTLAVESALADLLMALKPPKAVIMVGAYAPSAKFIKLAREMDFNPLFLNVSFVGTAPLAASLGAAGDGVIVTQVVPHYGADLPLVKAYRAALQAQFEALRVDPQPTFGSLEGYIAARILIRALVQYEGPLNRKTVIEALEQLGAFDMGLGLELELSPKRRQASHMVWPTVLRAGKVEPFEWAQLAEHKDSE